MGGQGAHLTVASLATTSSTCRRSLHIPSAADNRDTHTHIEGGGGGGGGVNELMTCLAVPVQTKKTGLVMYRKMGAEVEASPASSITSGGKNQVAMLGSAL